MKNFTANNAKFQLRDFVLAFLVSEVFLYPASYRTAGAHTASTWGGSSRTRKGTRCICKVITPKGFQWSQSQAAGEGSPVSFLI